jgi:hypothetical protein
MADRIKNQSRTKTPNQTGSEGKDAERQPVKAKPMPASRPTASRPTGEQLLPESSKPSLPNFGPGRANSSDQWANEALRGASDDTIRQVPGAQKGKR